jgi:hypothetical protein
MQCAKILKAQNELSKVVDLTPEKAAKMMKGTKAFEEQVEKITRTAYPNGD